MPRVMNDAETFLTAHESSNSFAELARALGIKEGSARVRTSNYRKLGYDLKTYPRQSSRVSVATGNELLAKLREGKNVEV